MSGKGIALYPASLDPIHNGHIDVAIRASRFFDKIVVAIYANPNKKRILFEIDERVELARRIFQNYPSISVAKYNVLTVEYAKLVDAVALIRGLRVFGDFEFEFRMGMANKKLAPELETIMILSDEQHMHISSSTIREIAELGGDVSSMVPPIISQALRSKFGN
ncbi:MAG: pantetheine-phosphate adenylyltransferase [Chloroflexota bacterium]|nr:pantetheine-phosphate adenylyltransferase [Chloroflexota bacterium]MDE2948343.1 pantetheine-phosphate adenylyltransferase [Chloroflexota bacterium]